MKRFWKKAGRTAVVLVFLLGLLAPGGAPLADTARAVTQADIDDLKGDADDLAQQRNELKSQLANLKNDKANALTVRSLLDRQITLTEQEIANTESQIAGYEALLSQTAYELEENQKQEEEQYALFCERARIMEKEGTPSFWAVLFKATSFSDLLSRLSDVQMVVDYNQSVLDELRSIQEEIKEKQVYQEELKGEAEAAKATLEAQKADLAVQREEANQLVKELEADVAAYESTLKEIAEEEERIQKEIVEKSNQLAEEMGWTATAGGYIWPVSTSKRITSPMGSRNTGIKGASTNHKGVDIGGVGYNTTVLATKAGKVITSAYSSSYGNYVVISHGPGNTTLYAHMSSRSVSEGDMVEQGDPIGVTGSTGISSGPHLHYEITENGSRVDPLTYLPGYIKAW